VGSCICYTVLLYLVVWILLWVGLVCLAQILLFGYCCGVGVFGCLDIACGEEVRHVSTSGNWQRLQRGEGDLVG
jgi:hypothetical protein